MKVKFGITPYINALPFLQNLGSQIDVIFNVPVKLNSALRENQLDVSLISSVEYLKGDYEFVAPFGIASQGKILSVNLYIDENHLSDEELICSVTNESATSVQLLKIIVTKFWKKKIIIQPLNSEKKPTSFLFIGNAALEKQHIQGYKTFDLATLWKEFTGLDFVFALFATKRGNKVDHVLSHLQQSLTWSLNNWDTIIHLARERSRHDKSFLATYFSCHKYILNSQDLKGLNHFASYIS